MVDDRREKAEDEDDLEEGVQGSPGDLRLL